MGYPCPSNCVKSAVTRKHTGSKSWPSSRRQPALTATRRRRHEFHRMIDRARADRDISMIIVHDFSRFGRDSSTAKSEIQELRRAGVEVVSVTDPRVDEDTAAGVYMQAITFAKNEAYSKEVRVPHPQGLPCERPDPRRRNRLVLQERRPASFRLPRGATPAGRGETRAPSYQEHLGAG